MGGGGRANKVLARPTSQHGAVPVEFVHQLTVTPINDYKLRLPTLLLRRQSQQPLELVGNVGLTNHASLRRRVRCRWSSSRQNTRCP